jgi:capsular exopolysaccharide synthesis family protein
MTGTGQQPVRNPEGAGPDVASIGEYLTILLDEWRTLVIPFLLIVAGTLAYLATAVPTYSASGVIQVSTSDESGAIQLFEVAGLGRPSPVETEVEILRSSRILGKAARKLGLNLSAPQPLLTFDLGVSIRGASPVDPALFGLRRTIRNIAVADWVDRPIPAVFTVTADGSLHLRLDEPAREDTVAPGGAYDQAGIRFEWAGATGLPSGQPISAEIVPDGILVADLLERLGVESIGGRKETNLVRLTARDQDRGVARDLVNGVMDAYMDFALEWRTLRADRSAGFIEGQLEAIRQSLEQSEAELQSFLEVSGAVLLPEQAKELIRGGSELELELRKVRIQEEVLSAVAGEISRATARGGPVALTGDFILEDELLGRAIGVLNDLELKRETLMTSVTETHPEVQRLGEEIRRVRAQVLEFVRASRERTKERRRSITSALDDIQGQLATFPDKERQMAAHRRGLDVSQELYSFLMTKLEESRIVKASTTTDKRIIDLAATPYKRHQPRRATTLALAAILGLLLGVGAVFLRRAADPRIRDEEEAKQLAGLPLYGVIPDLRILRVRGDVDELWKAPKGPAAEAFRTLRTNVEFAQVGDKPIRVIQVTSSEASEGKSTVISNLAVALAKAGHKVLIADLDLRRPVQNRIWAVPRVPGLSDHLAGRGALHVREATTWQVDVVPAGNEPPESQRLLASGRLAALMDDWRERYDYVLLDTPPLLVADSLVVSRLSDMVLFVIRPRVARRASLRLASQTLERMELVKGLVINGVATRRGGYYHYYRGSYYGSKTTDTQES